MVPNYLENIPVEQTSSFYNAYCFLFYLRQRKSVSHPLKIHIDIVSTRVCVWERAASTLLDAAPGENADY